MDFARSAFGVRCVFASLSSARTVFLKISLKRACMFDALIEYALCGSQPRDESK